MNTTDTHSPLFQKYLERYDRGGCTYQQLLRLQQLGILKDWEVVQIITPGHPEPNSKEDEIVDGEVTEVEE